MKNPLILTSLLAVSLVISGCASTPADEIDANLPDTSSTEPSVAETEVEELTEKIENDNVEIVQRSLTDFNSLNATVAETIADIDKNGIAQIEAGLFGDSINVFDASRQVGKRGLTVYDQNDPAPIVLWMSEDMLSSARTFDGFYRIDMLISEIEAIKGILDFDLSSPDGSTTAADYERITTANGFAFSSPGSVKIEVEVTVVNGKISKIVDTHIDGTVTYEFDYNMDNYSKYFELAY